MTAKGTKQGSKIYYFLTTKNNTTMNEYLTFKTGTNTASLHCELAICELFLDLSKVLKTKNKSL